MPTRQEVRDALDRHGVPQAGATNAGYHVEDGPNGTVLVRWGSGEPFKPDYGIPSGRKFRSCVQAVTGEGLRIVPDGQGNFMREDSGHHMYFIVIDRT
jgi:hypothetical protein